MNNTFYDDVFTGDEMMSDLFKFELSFQNAIMKIKGKYK